MLLQPESNYKLVVVFIQLEFMLLLTITVEVKIDEFFFLFLVTVDCIITGHLFKLKFLLWMNEAKDVFLGTKNKNNKFFIGTKVDNKFHCVKNLTLIPHILYRKNI